MPDTRLRPPPGLPRALARSRLTACGVRPFIVAVVITVGVLTGATGCATASKATPVSTTFPLTEPTLDVRSHDVPTDLVPSRRSDVKVTRWFATKLATGVRSSWTLTGRTLDLRADCTGLANCDARFRVEVPTGTTVLRDGKQTELDGSAGGSE